MEKYFIAHRHFSRSRRFITLAVFHFQIEMSRNYPISLFIITSNTFSVQFHTGPWFIAVARWTDVCWQHGSGMSPNPLGTRYQAREQHGKFHSETHPRKQLIYILFIHFFLSCPVLFQISRASTYSWHRNESLWKFYYEQLARREVVLTLQLQRPPKFQWLASSGPLHDSFSEGVVSLPLFITRGRCAADGLGVRT